MSEIVGRIFEVTPFNRNGVTGTEITVALGGGKKKDAEGYWPSVFVKTTVWPNTNVVKGRQERTPYTEALVKDDFVAFFGEPDEPSAYIRTKDSADGKHKAGTAAAQNVWKTLGVTVLKTAAENEAARAARAAGGNASAGGAAAPGNTPNEDDDIPF